MGRQFLVNHLQLREGEHSVGAREENLTWPPGNVARGSAQHMVRERLLVPLSPELHLALLFLFLRFTMEGSLVIAKILGINVSTWSYGSQATHFLPAQPLLIPFSFSFKIND